MQLLLQNLKVRIEEDGIEAYKKSASKRIKKSPDEIIDLKITRKSLDARDKNQFFYNLSLLITVPPLEKEEQQKEKKVARKLKERPIIVGFGPAGIFAALTFLEYGIKPIIFERGSRIGDRDQDIAEFNKTGKLNTESNIQFGEGGAGAYSDGKLTTRSKEKGSVSKVLETFIKFGAPEEIGYVNKPHLGTDRLKVIIKNLRKHILEQGGEIYFNSKLTDFNIEDGKINYIVINGQEKVKSEHLILATGHSARETYQKLKEKSIKLQAKSFAAGIRIEHPAELINLMQYGEKYKDYPGLGAADYSFTYKDKENNRGVYTFCMCPGGEVINASSEEGLLAINGMSNSKRDGKYSNSAVVVTVTPEDFGSDDPLAGIEFQRMIEKKAILPDFVSNSLEKALRHWEARFPLFSSRKAKIYVPETRTSAPVRILRNEQRQAEHVSNLYPVGEGSGYAGGIVSSAVDGIKAVEAILKL
ncbi:NAD(P)/FAD-dependent oxidoreductase [Candidatus Margulisiibacteriota bacterium]